MKKMLIKDASSVGHLCDLSIFHVTEVGGICTNRSGRPWLL